MVLKFDHYITEHTHTHTHTYIYIYISLCVCVCTCCPTNHNFSLLISLYICYCMSQCILLHLPCLETRTRPIDPPADCASPLIIKNPPAPKTKSSTRCLKKNFSVEVVAEDCVAACFGGGERGAGILSRSTDWLVVFFI